MVAAISTDDVDVRWLLDLLALLPAGGSGREQAATRATLRRVG
jgi:hypothetical protein